MVQFLGWEDPLEKEMATQSSILAWEIPRTEEPGGLQSMGLQRVRHNLATQRKLMEKVQHIRTTEYVCFAVYQAISYRSLCVTPMIAPFHRWRN